MSSEEPHSQKTVQKEQSEIENDVQKIFSIWTTKCMSMFHSNFRI